MAPTDDHITPESIDLGHVLREARIHRRLSIDEASQELRIRRDYLAALEQNHWQDLPGEVYGQGFLRSYGRLLDLDGDRLVDVRRAQLGSTPNPTTSYEMPKRTGIYTVAGETSNTSRSPKHSRNHRQSSARPISSPGPISSRSIIALLVVFALLFLGGWYLLHAPGRRVTAPTTPRSSAPRARKTKASSTHHHHQTSGTTTPVTAVSTLTQGRITVATYDVPKALDVLVKFNGACWMGYSINGGTQVGHVYQAGQTLPLQATASLDMVFGTHAFTLTVNRQPVILPTTPVLWQLNFVISSAP